MPLHKILKHIHNYLNEWTLTPTKYGPNNSTLNKSNSMSQDGRNGPGSSVVRETTAGLVSGLIQTVICQPLDVVKVQLQLAKTAAKIPASTHTGAQVTRPNTFSVARTIINSDRPLRNFYQGFTPNVTGNIASQGFFFLFKDLVNNHVLKPYIPNGGQLRPRDHFISGALAGALTSLVTNPVWVVKSRMMKGAGTEIVMYNTMREGLIKIWRHEPRALMSGTGMGMFLALQGGLQFAIYEPMKLFWQQDYARDNNIKDVSSVVVNPFALSFAAIFSKAVASTTLYPFQVVRTRLQMPGVGYGAGVRGVVGLMWQQGFRTFWAGLGPSLLKMVPNTLVQMTVYEQVKLVMRG